MLMTTLRRLFGGKAAQAQERQVEGPDGRITLKTAAVAPSLQAYGHAFQRWQGDKGLRFTDQDVIDMLGAWLGHSLVGEFDMEWYP